MEDQHIYIFEDTTGYLSFENIVNDNSIAVFQFKQPTRVFEKKSKVWMRFSLSNNSADLRKLILFFNDWDVSIWRKSGGNFSYLGRQGILAKNTATEFYIGEDYYSTILEKIPPGETFDYYIQTNGLFQTPAYFVAVQDLEAANEKMQRDLWAIGIFTGCFAFIFLANLLLLFSSPKWRNVFYALNCICYFLFFTGYYGIDYFVSIPIPITHTVFLPFSTLFYALFVFNYLELRKHSKYIGGAFGVYILLLSAAVGMLLYFYFSDNYSYFVLVRKVNAANFFFTIFSLIAISRVPGKPKYFIFIGVFFLFTGSGIYWYLIEIEPYHPVLIYPMMGDMLEMVAFLFGNIYLLREERRQALHRLSEKEKELERKKEQLTRFSAIIKEKNKLIDDFQNELNRTDDGKIEYTKQLIESIILTEKDWEEFKSVFEEVHKNFFVKLRSRRTDLTEGEIRLAALTKLDLSTKEMARMLGISPESVNKSRYRLRKKLSEKGEDSLEELIN